MPSEERDAEMQYAETPAGMGDEHMIEPERDAEMLGDPGSVDYYVRQLEDALRQRNAECRALRSEKAAMAAVVEAARRWKEAQTVGGRFAAAEELERLIDVLDAAEGGAS